MNEDWITCRVKDLSKYELGGDWGKSPDFEDKDYVLVACIRGTEFKNWDLDKGSTAVLRKVKRKSLEKRILREGDILVEISGGGPEQPVGRTELISKSVFNRSPNKNVVYTNFLRLLRPTQLIVPQYLNLFLKYFYSTGEIIKYQGGSNNLRNLKFPDFLTIAVPLAPLPIQRVSVSKIEELFSSLDSGIADLKKAQEQLKVYRQVVLKKAFEGGLTQAWRKKHPNLPTPQNLLEETRKKREEHFKKQLEDWKKALQKWKDSGKGKKPIKPKTLKFFDEPVREIDLNIPDNWFFDTIGNLSTGVEYGSSAKSLDDGDIPVIRMGNMQEGKINWDDLKYSISLDEINQYLLKSGDVLFNRTNSPELVGKSALYNGERDAIFAGYLIRVNHVSSIILSSYLNYFLNSHPAKVYGSFVKTDGVNQSNINGQKLSNYPIPLCSIEEQKGIVKKLDEIFAVCESINIDISEGLKKAEALRQSIFKKAFEGKLLSEEEIEKCKKEHDYEPADLLLQRIKAEKEKK